jgi:hypothetical protein
VEHGAKAVLKLPVFISENAKSYAFGGRQKKEIAAVYAAINQGTAL